MNLTTTLLFYLLFGSAVALAVYLADGHSHTASRWFQALSAVLFWPLFLPALLQPPANPQLSTKTSDQIRNPQTVNAESADELSAMIAQVETELDLALTSLGGWSDAVLTREQHRFDELRLAWHAQAARIRELDQVLSQLEPADSTIEPPPATNGRVANSQRSRQANISRLRALRDRYQADLANTLAWVRELVTMIHLAKFTGAPASRAEELVMQIATSVEGLSEVAAWHEPDNFTAAEPAQTS